MKKVSRYSWQTSKGGFVAKVIFEFEDGNSDSAEFPFQLMGNFLQSITAANSAGSFDLYAVADGHKFDFRIDIPTQG